MDAQNIISDISQPGLEEAMNANHGAVWSAVGQHVSSVKTYRDAKIAWLSSSLDLSYFNIVIPVRLENAEQDAAVVGSIERAKAQRVSTEWWTSPSADADGLSERLLANGFAHVGGPAGMAVNLTQLNEDIPRPSHLEIRRVENQTMLAELVDTLVTGWPLPEAWRAPYLEGVSGYRVGDDLKLQHYIGYVDGAPAAIASVILSDGVAGIYAVVTKAKFRGQGLGAALTLTPMLDARAKGYKVGILQASSMGYPVYLRLGFADLFHYKIFRWSPQSR